MVTKNVKINEPYYGTLHLHNRISWSAILIGALVGIGLTFLLNLFCVAIGVSVFTVGNDGAIALVVDGIVSMLVGIIAAMVAAGYAAGYLGPATKSWHSIWFHDVDCRDSFKCCGQRLCQFLCYDLHKHD